MKFFFRAGVLSLSMFLSGCATETTLILLPDASGKVGAITVKTDGDFRVINQAYQPEVLKPGASALAMAPPESETQINQEYRRLLQAEPKPSTSFILYFKLGTVDLIKSSRLEIPAVIARIKERLPTEITVIGHTDTTGSDDFNDRLSLRRAKTVARLLKANIPALEVINVQYFGAKNLLIPTAPNVVEQKNRGVEILVL